MFLVPKIVIEPNRHSELKGLYRPKVHSATKYNVQPCFPLFSYRMKVNLNSDLACEIFKYFDALACVRVVARLWRLARVRLCGLLWSRYFVRLDITFSTKL